MGVPNSSFYPHRVKKNFIFSEIFPFLGNKCTFGGTKLQFLSPSGQKNFIFSEIFPFLGNKCTFGGTKLQFLSPFVNFSIFREQMYIWGYQKKTFLSPSIFSEIFPFLGNKCTFGAIPNSSFPHIPITKLQWSKKCTLGVHF